VDKAADLAAEWHEYFYRIRQQCPWSWAAWQQGQISIHRWQGRVIELGDQAARIYTVKLNRRRLKRLAQQLDLDPVTEWLWSEPSYGPMATPVPVLIQQDRRRLTELRNRLEKQ
jgi:hypothetical protein